MGQRVDYEPLIGARYEQYLMKLRLVIGFVSGPGGSEFKAFRDFLRKNGLWEKEKSAVAFSLVDIVWDRKTVRLGPFARAIAETTSDDVAKDMLYTHLKDNNILLVKYVLEALDVESGGRLHSVHELYRMVTSYVYPGEYITLPNFQAWIEWIAATGYVKMVGIRWALSDKGLEAVSELKGMDVEEILEDLEEEAEDTNDSVVGDDWGVPAVQQTTPSFPQESRESASFQQDRNSDVESTDEKPSSDEDWFDTPPEANPPTLEDIEAAEASFMEQFADIEAVEEAAQQPSEVHKRETVDSVRRQPTSTVQHEELLNEPRPRALKSSQAGLVHAGVEAAALVSKIVGWWNALGDWPVLTARELGFEAEAFESPEDAVLELAALAAVIEALEPQPQIFAFVQVLRDVDFFKSLQRAKSGPQVLGALDAVPDDVWMRGLRERLVVMSAVFKRHAESPGIVERLQTAGSPREAVLMLRDGLFGESFSEAPFWVLREMVKIGFITNEEAHKIAIVPSERLLTNAASIGLIPQGHVASFEQLIASAEKVASYFGPDSGYGEALEVMDRALKLGA